MPLNAGNLGDEIKAQLLLSGIANEDDGQLQITCDAIATAVVNHIVANANVTITAAQFSFQSGSTPSPIQTGGIT